jgi:hypothetical protein
VADQPLNDVALTLPQQGAVRIAEQRRVRVVFDAEEWQIRRWGDLLTAAGRDRDRLR